MAVTGDMAMIERSAWAGCDCDDVIMATTAKGNDDMDMTGMGMARGGSVVHSQPPAYLSTRTTPKPL